MPSLVRPLRRRAVLRRLSGLVGAPLVLAPAAAIAAPAPAGGAGPVRVAQLVDTSPNQQELARDYASGLQLALTEAARAGGRSLQLVRFEVGGEAAVAQALREIRRDDALLALVGCVGERVALAAAAGAAAQGFDIAQVGPWLADPRFDGTGNVYPIFASRDAQIEHALRSLAHVGVAELGVVHPDPQSQAAMAGGIAAIAQRLRLRVESFAAPAGVELARFARPLPPSAPALLLFLGGALELAQFTQGLATQGRSRYVVCLADVDIAMLMQLGPARSVPVIVTQVVPNPQSSALPVVMSYRARLKELFDEAPSPLGLAGYLVGRYALHALAGLNPSLGRAGAIAELKRRPALDLGGFRIDFSRGGRGSDFVSQTLLRHDGRLIG